MKLRNYHRFMRLDKFLANAEVGSRSEVKKLVKQKLVKVNGELAKKPEMDVDYSDDIWVGEDQIILQENVYLMYHKPAGFICANKDKYQKTIFDLIEYPKKTDLQICGRLDIDVTGLVILTNHGEFNHLLTTPKKGFHKEYVVTFEGDARKLKPFYENGITLENDNNYETHPFYIDIKNDHTLIVKVVEGRFHLVKNIIDQLGLILLQLHRIKVGPYTLPNDLEVGELREIENLL